MSWPVTKPTYVSQWLVNQWFMTLLPSWPQHRARGAGGSGQVALLCGSRPSWSASVLTVTCRRGNCAIHHPNQDIFESERDVYKKGAEADSLFLAHTHILQ